MEIDLHVKKNVKTKNNTMKSELRYLTINVTSV